MPNILHHDYPAFFQVEELRVQIAMLERSCGQEQNAFTAISERKVDESLEHRYSDIYPQMALIVGSLTFPL